jgi:hypothetical protein
MESQALELLVLNGGMAVVVAVVELMFSAWILTSPTSAIRRVRNGYTLDFLGISLPRSALHGVFGDQARETACAVIFGGG